MSTLRRALACSRLPGVVKRSLASVMMLVVLACGLAAEPVSFDWSLGTRRSSIEDEPMFFALTVSYAGAAFRFQTDMGDIFDLALSYDIDQGSTLTHTFSTTMQTVPWEGGFNTLSYIFSQDLVFDWFHVKYAAGLQTGMSWSPYSLILQWSISPLLELRTGIRASGFHADVFATSFLAEERSWKSTLCVGFETGIEVDRQLAFYVRGYAELAEVLMNPYITVAGYGIGAGVVLRGLE